jgi:hypothetical protein
MVVSSFANKKLSLSGYSSVFHHCTTCFFCNPSGVNTPCFKGHFLHDEEAAEKGLFSNESDKKHTEGAKAQHLFCCTCGPTKVVPFYKTSLRSSFSAACEVVP